MKDGIDHINIYSKGATELGRKLSNFANTPFEFEEKTFQSVEGFWYWHLTGRVHNELCNLHGWKAKSEGQKFRNDRVDKDGISEKDKSIILEAIRCKLRQNKDILKMLIESNLPLRHYYEYGDKKVYLPQYNWIIEEISRIRDVCQKKNFMPM